jgi:hypothetical protein
VRQNHQNDDAEGECAPVSVSMSHFVQSRTDDVTPAGRTDRHASTRANRERREPRANEREINT